MIMRVRDILAWGFTISLLCFVFILLVTLGV